MHNVIRNPLADIDPRLLTEAFRRARERVSNTDVASTTLFSAIIDEARRGARDIYSLVKAANAAADVRRNLAA